LILAAVCLWAPAAPAAEIPYRERTLTNGLRVILHDDDRLPIVAVEVHYAVGTMHDPVSARGLVHTIEHMMFRGSGHVPDGDHFFHLQDAGAVGTNASTRSEDMSYVETVPARGLETALWLESDRMGFFTPSADALASERETVANEWHTRVSSDPRAILMEQVWNALFDERHPYHHESAASVTGVTIDELKRIAGAHIGPANATLVLAGALPTDIDATVDRYFGTLRGGARPAPVDVRRTLDREIRLTPGTDMSRTPIALVGWPTPGLHEPGDAEADILASALNHEVFESLARAEGIDTEQIIVFEAQQMSMVGQSAMFMIATGPPGQDPQQLLRAIDTVLAAVAREGLPTDDVRRAGKRLTIDMLSILQTLEGRASLLATYAATGHDPDWITEDVARYDQVDAQAVAAFTRRFLRGPGRVVMLNEGS
jgi:predicted Zn-dependent peptidase